jgi:hypothetical protein
MRARLRRQKLTHQEYLLFPEDGRHHEIIDGPGAGISPTPGETVPASVGRGWDRRHLAGISKLIAG